MKSLLVLSKKKIFTFTAFIILLFFSFHSQNFRLDASSDTLILQNDKNFKYFNYYNNIFPTKNFLVLAIKSTTIAILGIGYADGVSRKLSNKGKVFYKKKKFNIIGKVSMDTTTINITKYKKIIKKGIYMELINHKYDIEKMAKECGTISNEILTSISNRVKRYYI